MVVLENIDESDAPPRERVPEPARAAASTYGLSRTDGFAFDFPGKGIALVDLTHIETSLDPIAASRIAPGGKAQAARVVAFLRAEFSEAYGKSRLRSYGLPGIRQSRWIIA